MGSNPLGECGGCEGQIFISDNCMQSFYCSLETESDGCLLSCEENQRVHVDYSTNTWECVEKEDSFMCPGQFSVDCTDILEVECHCQNEIWMRPGCSGAYVCSGEQNENGLNFGRTVWCIPPEVLQIDFTDVTNYELSLIHI